MERESRKKRDSFVLGFMGASVRVSFRVPETFLFQIRRYRFPSFVFVMGGAIWL